MGNQRELVVEPVNILLVDDHPNNLLALEAILESPGYRLVRAESGYEALARITDEDFALVLLDVQMPGMDGFETASQIKSLPRANKLPIIFITAIEKSDLNISRGYSLGAVDYLLKPIDPDILKAKVLAFANAFQASERQRAVERQQLLDQLERERNLFRAVLQQMPAGVIVGEAPHGKLIFGNQQIEKILGYKFFAADHFEQYSQYHGYHHDGSPLQPEDWPMTQAITAGETISGREIHFYSPDKKKIIIRASAAPIRDARGEITAGVVTFYDVSELKQREQLLDTQKRLLEMIATGVALPELLLTLTQMIEGQYPETVAAVLTLDRNNQSLRHLAAASLPAELITALDNQFALSSNETGAVETGDLDAISAKMMISQDIASDPNWLKYRDLAARHQLRACWSVPILASDHSSLGLLAIYYREARQPDEHERNLCQILTNIAGIAIERANIEEERTQLLNREKQARQQAEKASRVKDDFLATVSHELRTPMTAILGWARLLRGQRLEGDAQARAIETIERNARTQAQLIDDILDVSRIITGKLRLDIRPVELSEIINATLANIQNAVDAKQIEIKKDLDPWLGPVSGNPNRLQQIMWNLLSNAVKFTPKHGKIEIRLEQVDSNAQITVRDNGRGIQPEFLPYIYDYFFQQDNSFTREYGGLGLGLSIVRHLVELHGGSVHADSNGEGQGATFTVKLPLLGIQIDNKGEPITSINSENIDFQVALKDLKILVVEDNFDTRELIRSVLEQSSAMVKTAGNAADAFKELINWRPDLVISDIGMAEENGYELIRRVRQLKPEEGGMTLAIALTAYARAEDRLRSLTAGFQAHLAKPVEPADLIAEVTTLTRRMQTRED